MKTLNNDRSAWMRVVMGLDFQAFDEEQRSAFKLDLARVLGISETDLDNTRFREGCVISETEISETVIRLFLELVQILSDGSIHSTSPEVRQFIEKYHVQNINALFPAPMQNHTQPAPRKQQLVFVHGWDSSYATAFGKLPDYLNVIFDSATVPFDYPTSKLGHSPPIYHLARALENHFRMHVSADNVAMIAHSMGGLVARKLLVSQRDRPVPLDNYIKLITLVASPSFGSSLAAAIKHLPLHNSHQLTELMPNSGFISELHDQWQTWKDRKSPAECAVRCIYGTNDHIVDAAAAGSDDREAVPILGASHSNIIKPASPNDTIVTTLTAFLENAGFQRV